MRFSQELMAFGKNRWVAVFALLASQRGQAVRHIYLCFPDHHLVESTGPVHGIPLRIVDTNLAEFGEQFRGLHPFGDADHAEGVSEIVHGSNHGEIARVLQHFGDEAAVDFEDVSV